MRIVRSNDLALMLFSLAIALVLAYLVRSDSNSAVTVLSVPVEFVDVPSDRVLVAGGITQVKVTVRGPSFVVNRIANSVPSIRVKVPPQVDDHFTAVLSTDEFDLPSSMSVIRIEPEALALEFDKLISKDVPVVLPRIGTVADGMFVEQVTITPEKVSVVGPSQDLEEVTQVESLPIDLKGARESREERLSLRLPASLSRLTPSEVLVKVQVSKIQEERVFSGLPIELRTKLSESYGIYPREVAVAVRGDRDAIRALQRESIVPYLRLDSQIQKSEEISLTVELPPGLKATAINPPTVKVSLLRPRLKSK